MQCIEKEDSLPPEASSLKYKEAEKEGKREGI